MLLHKSENVGIWKSGHTEWKVRKGKIPWRVTQVLVLHYCPPMKKLSLSVVWHQIAHSTAENGSFLPHRLFARSLTTQWVYHLHVAHARLSKIRNLSPLPREWRHSRLCFRRNGRVPGLLAFQLYGDKYNCHTSGHNWQRHKNAIWEPRKDNRSKAYTEFVWPGHPNVLCRDRAPQLGWKGADLEVVKEESSWAESQWLRRSTY